MIEIGAFNEWFFWMIDRTTDSDPACCDKSPKERHAACWPIEIPENDPFYSLFRRRCMEFVRSASSLKPECKLGIYCQLPQYEAINFWSSMNCNVNLVQIVQLKFTLNSKKSFWTFIDQQRWIIKYLENFR